MLNWRDISNPSAGGAEVVVDNIIEFLRKGNKITFFTSYFPGSRHIEQHGSLRILRRGSMFTVYLHALLYLLKNRRNFDAVVESVSTVPFFTPLVFNKKKVIIVHHFMGRRVFLELPFYKAFAAYIAEKLIPVLYKKSFFIAMSGSVAEELKNAHVRGVRISVCNPDASFRFNEMCKARHYKKFALPTIVTVSRLMRYKRVGLLIQLFSKLPKELGARLIIIGSGKEEHALKLLSKRLNIGNKIKFAGAVSEREKTKYLKKAWVFATASSMEGFGLSVLEAEKCGTPAVVFGVGGISEALRNNYSGFVVREGDYGSYVSKLHKLLADQELRSKMSANALVYGRKFNSAKLPKHIMSMIRHRKGLRRAQAPG